MVQSLKSIAKLQKSWGTSAQMHSDYIKLLRYKGSFFGLDQIVTNLGNWDFDNSEKLKEPAETLLQSVDEWERHRNGGDPVNVNADVLRSKTNAVLNAAESLERALK